MRKSVLAAVSLCLMTLLSCINEVGPQAPKLYVEQESVLLAAEDGASSTITIIATRDWTASISDSKQIKVSPESGKAGTEPQTITVYASLNEGRTRNATIKIVAGMMEEKIPVFQAGLTPDIETIKNIREFGVNTVIPEGYKIKGVVTSDYTLKTTTARACYIQDETGGIQLDMGTSHTYARGTELEVDIAGQTIGAYGEALQLPVGKVVVTGRDKPVVAKEITVDQILEYEGSYVSIKAVQVKEADLEKKFIMESARTNINMEDRRGGGFVISTNKDATIGKEKVPQGSGTLKGIAGRYNSTKQLVISSEDDYADMTGGRFTAGTPAFTVTGEDKTIGLQATEIHYSLSANVDWTATVTYPEATAEFVTLNTLSGYSNADITAAIPENTTGGVRTATITFRTEDEGVATKEYSFTITQSNLADPPKYNMTCANTNVAFTGGTVVVRIEANVPWTLAVSEGAVVAEADMSGNVDRNVTVTVGENLTETPKTVTITLTTEDGNIEAADRVKTIELTVAGIEFSTVAEVLAMSDDTALWTKGTVMATNTRGLVLSDGTGCVYVYKGSDTGRKAGDKVTVSGNRKDSYGFPQIAGDNLVINFTEETATVTHAVPKGIDAWFGSSPLHTEYVEYTGILTLRSEKYFDVSVNGSTKTTSIYYQDDAMKAVLEGLVGEQIKVTGYTIGTYQTSQAHIMIISATKDDSPYLTLSEYSGTIPAKGGSVTFAVNTNATSWSYTVTAGYESNVSIDGNNVTVTLGENTDVENAKTVEVTITADGAAAQKYTVTQRKATNLNGPRYVKVTEAPEDWSGKYLIVYDAAKVAFNGSLSSSSSLKGSGSAPNTVSVEIEDGVIIATDDIKRCSVDIAAVEGGYSIKTSSGFYIGNPDDSADLESSQTYAAATHKHTFNYTDAGIEMQPGGVCWLAWAIKSEYFRYYKQSNFAGYPDSYAKPSLYKYTE